jgi:uncharacterized repeat protein (TIGR01451 family)
MSEYRFEKPLKALLAALAALALTALALVFFSQLPQRALAGIQMDVPLQGGEPLRADIGAGEAITNFPTTTPRYPADTMPPWLANSVNPAANGDLEMVLSAPAEIDNGDTITYYLSVTNRSGAYRSNIRILDVLPKDADGKYILSEVQCTPTCGRSYQTEVIREPLGSTVTVTITRQVSWTVSLNDGQSTNVAFWGPVVGQEDGTVIENLAFGFHPDIGSATSNDVQTIVRVRPSQPGYPSLSAAPTWLSADLGGTMNMDWGDFDQDGDLDLVLASTAGTFIYINREGRLKSYWQNERYALGVRWADFDNDGQLELVAVGESVDNTATGLSPVYFYEESGGTFQQTHVFTSPTQLVRVEPGDYDNDGDLDIVVTTNSINASCPVKIYENLAGILSFSDSDTECVSRKAAANISPVDYDNDGDLDLVTGEFPNTVRLWINGGSMGSTFVTSATLLPALSFLPYDFAWGDYDGDDDLDLAAAFPLQRRARLYRNDAGTLTFFRDFRTTLFRTPLAVEWGDFDGDGTLDLAVADSPPKIYLNKDGVFAANEPETQQTSFVQGQIWSMAAADADIDGDLDLMIGNRDGSSLLFTTFSPFLDDSLSSVGALNTSHVAWGDVDDDGDIDLLYSGSQGEWNYNAWIYKNNGGSFSLGADDFSFSGVGPRAVALGDIDNDKDLDFALSTIDGVHIYVNGTGNLWTEDILSTSDGDVNALGWGDAESDGDLDLFVGQNGRNTLYINQGGTIQSTPHWTSVESENTTSVAWGDYDGDLHLDVAVANRNGRVRVYHNNHDQTFTSVWQSAASYNARSVAWGDVDGDKDLDLAVGNYGQVNVIFENVDGTLGTSPIWDSSPELYNTTSIAWGDWDNDGDLDLAVGNYGQVDQVYDNPGSLPLEWRWTSTETLQTTAVVWGDQDGDGDLDLAISQESGGQVGVYENTYAYPSHLHPPSYSGPLPNNPAYVSIKRPGSTADAYFYSTQEILGKPSSPTVTIEYVVYDAEGDRIVDTIFQYSIDGGGTWLQATPAVAPTRAFTATPTGTSLTFEWDAQAEAEPAIGDNALFRISITHTNPSGPVQEAKSSATSPPFRLEGTTCAWPEEPEISFDPNNPDPGQPVDFEGDIQPGTGSEQVVYTWDFGDGSDPVDAQDVQHIYAQSGVFQVRLTVTSAPCPIQKQLSVIRTITVGSGVPNIYLPLVLRSYSGN